MPTWNNTTKQPVMFTISPHLNSESKQLNDWQIQFISMKPSRQTDKPLKVVDISVDVIYLTVCSEPVSCLIQRLYSNKFWIHSDFCGIVLCPNGRLLWFYEASIHFCQGWCVHSDKYIIYIFFFLKTLADGVYSSPSEHPSCMIQSFTWLSNTFTPLQFPLAVDPALVVVLSVLC